jgi:hypothetical protein
MNKKAVIRGVFVAVILIISACVPSTGLQGTGGLEEVPATEDSVAVTEPPTEPSTNDLNEMKTIEFLQPSIIYEFNHVTQTYSPGLSIPPMGNAEYQLYAPKILLVGERGVIELIIAPDTLLVEKTKTFQVYEENISQVFQYEMDIYPLMSAEIIYGNKDSISIDPLQSTNQIVTLENTTTWLWQVTALQAGNNVLRLQISVPVLVEGKEIPYTLETIQFTINATEPTPTPTATSTSIPTSTPTPTSTPIPTNTPIPSFVTQLSGSAASITIAIIGSFGAILAAIIGTVINLALKNNKENKEKEAEQKRLLDKEKKDKKIIDSLKKPKKQK